MALVSFIGMGGSSPQVRGPQPQREQSSFEHGLIPAGAGTTERKTLNETVY